MSIANSELQTCMPTAPVDEPICSVFVPVETSALLLMSLEQCRHVAETTCHIIRKESWDADRFTLEKSRTRSVICMHAGMKCLDSNGFEMIVNRVARIHDLDDSCLL